MNNKIANDLRKHLSEIFEVWEDDITDEDVLDLSQYALASVIENSEKFLIYRYMPANYFNIRNFETQTIHLSPNGVMNDIYEGIPICDTRITNQQISLLGDLAFMTCFTQSNDNYLMWSHYADNHKGICVEYDLKKLSEEEFAIKNHLFPIVYSDKRIRRNSVEGLIKRHGDLKEACLKNYIYDEGDLLNDILPMFLRKNIIWEYEQEWRIIYTYKQMYDINSSKLYSGNISFPCISGIYLGCSINPEIRKNILEIVDRANKDGRNLRVYQTNLGYASYNLEFEEIITNF